MVVVSGIKIGIMPDFQAQELFFLSVSTGGENHKKKVAEFATFGRQEMIRRRSSDPHWLGNRPEHQCGRKRSHRQTRLESD